MKKKEGEEQREGSRDIEEERKSVREKSDRQTERVRVRACASEWENKKKIVKDLLN